MASTILVLFVVLFAISVIPWLGNKNRNELHHTDLMAGDEGED